MNEVVYIQNLAILHYIVYFYLLKEKITLFLNSENIFQIIIILSHSAEITPRHSGPLIALKSITWT